jgi:hypothetical protein
MDPATIALIVGLVIQGGKMGYSYYESTQYALKQARIQRSMIEADQAQVALALHNNFPNVTFDEWLSIVSNSLASQEQTADGTNDIKSNWLGYVPYVAIGVIFIILLLRE